MLPILSIEQDDAADYVMTMTPVFLPDEIFHIDLGDGAAAIEVLAVAGAPAVHTTVPYAMPGTYNVVGELFVL